MDAAPGWSWTISSRAASASRLGLLCGDRSPWPSPRAADALIAALIARAAHLGFVEPVPEDAHELARTEGWIAIPTVDALGRLCSAPTRIRGHEGGGA